MLVNDQEQYSLWPTFVAAHRLGRDFGGPDGIDRDTALRYVDENWTDMRPRSLVEHFGVADATISPKSSTPSQTT